MTISEKVAHLKGLMEGMELDASAKETKLITAIVDILDDLALDLADVQDEQATMADYMDELDYDLGEVEEYLYEIDEDEDEFDEDDFDEGFVETECPECGKEFCFEADADPNDVVCPHCGGHFTCICQCDDEDADCSCCEECEEE